jgi:predicted DsbA family dithiol-disulfide isomerase
MVARIQMYADLHCPYAYLAAYRVRRVAQEFRGVVEVEHKALAIEYADEKVTPKRILDNETPLILLEEPEIPYAPWHRAQSEWPVTMWPAFEAVKCAQRQGLDAAAELDWRLREAFFGESRCISMRHVILDVAKRAKLDMKRFTEAFDSGQCKREVIEDARMGWETLGLQASPTFVLPDGSRRENPAAPKVHLDESRHQRVTGVDPAPAKGDAALDVYREMFRAAAKT